MRRRNTVLTAAVLAAGLVVPAALANPGDVIVDKADPAGDVKIFSYQGPSTAQRTSIDLRHFTLTEGDGTTRFAVRLKKIAAPARYQQIVEIRLSADDDAVWVADVTFSPQQPARSYASYSPTLDGDQVVTCDGLRAVVQRTRKTVSLDVPDRCLPTDPARIKVLSFYGPFRAEGVGYSQDRMRIPGAHALHVVS